MRKDKPMSPQNWAPSCCTMNTEFLLQNLSEIWELREKESQPEQRIQVSRCLLPCPKVACLQLIHFSVMQLELQVTFFHLILLFYFLIWVFILWVFLIKLLPEHMGRFLFGLAFFGSICIYWFRGWNLFGICLICTRNSLMSSLSYYFFRTK